MTRLNKNSNTETEDILGKIEFYIISLFLLFFLIIILTINIPICFGTDCKVISIEELLKTNVVTLISSIFLVSSICFYMRFNYKISGGQNNPFLIIEVENINYEHLVFLATYLVPLISLDVSKTRYAIVLLVLIVAMGIIYIRTNLFYMNPSLALLGYSIYKARGKFSSTDIRSNLILISKQKLHSGVRVHSRRLDENIYFVRIAK